MNKQSLLIVMMLVLFAWSCAWSEELPWDVKTPFKEATIYYELSGTEVGKETLYIQEFGARQAKHRSTTATLMGISKDTQTIQITDQNWIYHYDIREKTGGKTTNPVKIYRSEYAKLNAEEKKNFEKNAKELGPGGMFAQVDSVIRYKDDKILGFDCDIASVAGISTVYLLHKTAIPLKAETSVMGIKNNVIATKVDTSTPVPDDAFSAPTGITAQLDQPMESMMQEMVKNTVDTLKRADGIELMRQSGPLGMMGEAPLQQMLGREMEGDGDQEEQQELMRQINEALQHVRKQQPQK
ncbi:hypothetical protein [Desulfobulbus oligotrophicus]|uniref:DUF4412 domain-containing protein n=1 Tax=Desulfobulbus oligotrophicus TaxID=1909699 RepID=A0A7T6AQ02_9BACT|nr:hypothetical protein [Desulfobulbus oligotrophicus]QQG65058.1 hypothetical protein HP555_03845 [Desulfobulbus oligotrophicus]